MKSLHVILISHAPTTVRAVRHALGAPDDAFTLECARLPNGLRRLRRKGIAAVLLDLCQPDSQQSLSRFEQVSAAAPHIPVLLIGSPVDQDLVRQAVKPGAQDYYLQRTDLDREWLPRALRHVIDQHATDYAISFEQQRADATLNAIGDAVISTDLAGQVTYLNPVAAHLTGWSLEAAVGRPRVEILRIIDGATRAPIPDRMGAAIRLNRSVSLSANCVLIARDGNETPIEDSTAPIRDVQQRVIGAVMVIHDVGAAHKLALKALHRSQHDALTELPNRLLLNDRITQAIAMTQRHGHYMAVMFLDLNRFKHVNDSLGHGIGDALLRSVAGRLVTCVRGSDTVSRLGGDEFVVLLSKMKGPADAAISADRIMAALAGPHEAGHYQLHLSATIGISTCPHDGTDAATLIERADIAMYCAKKRGANCYQFFAPWMMSAREMMSMSRVTRATGTATDRATAFGTEHPVADAPDVPPRSTPPREHSDGAQASHRLSMPTILVVDDEASIRTLTRRFLERAGYNTLEAAGAFEAIGLLDKGCALDLLISDLSMPDLNGVEMVSRVRIIRPNLRVLYISAYHDLLARLRPAQNEAILSKPFTVGSLKQAVSALLRRAA